MTEIIQHDQFSAADACEVVGISASDLANWTNGGVALGTLVSAGNRSFRKFSAADLVALRLMLALTGPVCGRNRMFLPPALAFDAAMTIATFGDLLVRDEDGCIRPPLPAECWYACVGCDGDDVGLTVDLWNAEQLAARLHTVSNQWLVIPASRLAYETVRACADVRTKKYPAVVGRLARAAEQAVTPPAEAEASEEFADTLKREVVASLRAKGWFQGEANER